jgi:PIN domain nuclease of toxin-antitoxin system
MSELPVLPDEAAVEAIVDDAIHQFFAARHQRVRGFVDRHFSLQGTLALHRKAIGWDIARAPLNLWMAVPQAGLMLAAAAARKAGAGKVAERLSSRQLLVRTAVAEELAWLLQTELLELPARHGDRLAARDALAETILAHPGVTEAMRSMLERLGACHDDPALRARIAQAIEAYGATRAAAAEITTSLLTLGTGAITLQKMTPGAVSLGPALASALAQHAAVTSFPLGTSLGTMWYGLFPVAPSAVFAVGLTGSLMAVATVAAAFAGIIADPVQRRFGLHERRLHKLLDTLEKQITDPSAPGFVAHEHYVARVMDLFDLVGAAFRLASR